MNVRLPHLRRFVARIPRRRRPFPVGIAVGCACLLAVALAIASAIYLVARIVAGWGP